MTIVTTVSYKFRINGEHTDILRVKRGLRQGDLLFPLLFVIVMEYLYRVLKKLRNNPNFNFHAKCEKLGIINLSFADDLQLFTRGDTMSIELLTQAFNVFSNSTGLTVTPMKCNIYYGNVDDQTKEFISGVTTFSMVPLPFRYLGIPLTSKKLFVAHYLILVDKIMVKIDIGVICSLALLVEFSW